MPSLKKSVSKINECGKEKKIKSKEKEMKIWKPKYSITNLSRYIQMNLSIKIFIFCIFIYQTINIKKCLNLNICIIN